MAVAHRHDGCPAACHVAKLAVRYTAAYSTAVSLAFRRSSRPHSSRGAANRERCSLDWPRFAEGTVTVSVCYEQNQDSSFKRWNRASRIRFLSLASSSCILQETCQYYSSQIVESWTCRSWKLNMQLCRRLTFLQNAVTKSRSRFAAPKPRYGMLSEAGLSGRSSPWFSPQNTTLDYRESHHWA